MKVPLLFVFFLLLSSPALRAQADNYRAFEWDVLQIGYARTGGELFNGGGSVGTELRYNVSNRWSLGGRLQTTYFFANLEEDIGDVHVGLSLGLLADYYFEESQPIRPFVGLGLGSFGGADVPFDTETGELPDEIDPENGLGVVLRAGVELGHFRVALEYSAIGGRLRNYLGLNLAGTIGGGPR